MEDRERFLDRQIQEYVESYHQETIRLLKKLAAIPAFSGQEAKRADFVLRWLQQAGAAESFADAACNVVYPYQCDANAKLVVFMAHMDVVCPDTAALPVRETEGRLIGPGICDNTANLVNLLMAIRYLLFHSVKMKTGILFVADVGEEGLGNLRGSRQIYETYGSRIQEWISFDLTYDSVLTRAVGSRRYRISVKTEGGHSYHDFGASNAIALLAGIITELYHIRLPDISSAEKESVKVTYNVGQIEGGTSVNTIAQDASMLYEIRSESEDAICNMERKLDQVLQGYLAQGYRIQKEIIGIRPGNGAIDVQKQTALEHRCLTALAKYYKGEITCEAGSTDCNIPLSAGIPALTVGTALGGGIHTREEWVDTDSMRTGQKIALEMILSYAQ